MKTSNIIVFILLAACLQLYSQTGYIKTLANVGNKNIYLSDFEKRYENYLFATSIKDNIEVREAILNNMINEILLKDYDNNNYIYNNPEFQKELSWTKNQVILAFLKDREIYAKITATEDEARVAFQRMNKKIAARHLFAETKEEADNLYELLKMGVDFDSLAAKVFTDSTLKKSGGFLGYFTWGDMDPAFEDAAFSMKIGEISKPVKTEYGYSIIKVDDIIENPVITEYQFQQKKLQIEKAIRINKMKPAEKKYISDLVNTKKIKFNEDMLQNIFSNYKGLQNNKNEQASFSNSIGAQYKDIVYKYHAIKSKLNDLPGDYKQRINSVKDLKSVIEGFIKQDELIKRAYQKGYEKNDEVIEKTRKMEGNLFFKFKKDEVFDKAVVSDNDVLDFYQKNIYMFTKEPEINVREILVENKSLADSLIRLIKSGESFDKLAKDFSKRKWSAKNGGEMGYAPLSKFGMLKDRFLNEPVGSLIGPVQVENFYGIFKVIGKINGQPIEFSLVKSKAEKILKENKGKEIFQAYIDKLKNKVKVEINKNLLLNADVAAAQ